MCLLKLKSTNPKLSYILYKNPESGMQIKSIRQGYAYGFYGKAKQLSTKYIIYFRDGQNEMSYKEYPGQSYEYLNRLRYTTPIFVLNTISEFFNSTTNSKHNDDVDNVFTNQISNYAVNMDNHTFKTMGRLTSFFTDFKIQIVEKSSNTYKIKVQTSKSMYVLLNFAVTYFSLIAMLNDNDLDISEGLIDKLIRCANVIDSDYYIRYVISSRVLTYKKIFDKYKPLLEKPNMKLEFGNTAVQRRDYIQKMIQFDRSILDIGSGSGFFCIPFSQKLAKNNPTLQYYGIDIDEDELATVARKAKEKELLNIVLLNSHEKLSDKLDPKQSYDVIIAEVVEHMSKEQSQDIIRWVLNNVNYNKIIITTPNFEFNKYYHLEGFRHDDHKWELTTLQFKEYINEIVIGFNNLKVTYLQLGDMVDGISVSQGILIQKN